MDKDKESESNSSDVSLPASHAEEDKINLLDYLIVLAKHKKIVIGITFFTTLITVIASLVMPAVYKAETRILTPQRQASMGQMLGQIGAANGVGAVAIGAAGGLNSIQNPTDLYIQLLTSRPVLDLIVDRFNLMSFYKTQSRETSRKRLAGTVSAQADRKTGIMIVGVENGDPKKAADLANAFIEELIGVNNNLTITSAGKRRLFLEKQLKDAKDDMEGAEEAMKNFQRKTGVVMDPRASEALGYLSQLRAQIAAKELRLKVMNTFFTSQNPDVRLVEEEIKGLREQLGILESKTMTTNSMMPAGVMPAVGSEYVRKLRDVKFSEAKYELFFKQYQAAKFDEAGESQSIQIIEKAIPPEKREKPKRKEMAMFGAATGLLFSVFAVFIREYAGKALNDPQTKGRFETLKKLIAKR